MDRIIYRSKQTRGRLTKAQLLSSGVVEIITKDERLKALHWVIIDKDVFTEICKNYIKITKGK